MLIEWMRQSTNKAMLVGAAEAFVLERYEQEEDIQEMFRWRSSDGESITLADTVDILASCGLKRGQSGFVAQLSGLLGFAHPSEVRLDFQGYRGFLSLVAQRIGYAKETARARAAYFDKDDANRLRHVEETRASAAMDADSLHCVAKVLGFDLSPGEEAALVDLSSAAPPMGEHGVGGGAPTTTTSDGSYSSDSSDGLEASLEDLMGEEKGNDNDHDNRGGIEDGRLRENRRHDRRSSKSRLTSGGGRPTFGGAPSDGVEDENGSSSEYSLEFEDDADDATSDQNGAHEGMNDNGTHGAGKSAEGFVSAPTWSTSDASGVPKLKSSLGSAGEGEDGNGSDDSSMWSSTNSDKNPDARQNDEHGEDNNHEMEEEDATILSKRLKKTLSDVSKHLICPITQELMADPVIAEDGNTYERAKVLEWMQNNSTSPLDPSHQLKSSRVIPNRAVKLQAEQLVSSGELENALCAAYFERRRRMGEIEEEFENNDDADDDEEEEAEEEEEEEEEEEAYDFFESHAEDINPALRIISADSDKSDVEHVPPTQSSSRGVEDGRTGLPRAFDSRHLRPEEDHLKQRDASGFNNEAFARAIHLLGRQQLVEEINTERRERELEIEEAFNTHATWIKVKENRGSTSTSELLVLNRSGWKKACALLNLTWQDDVLDNVLYQNHGHLIYFTMLLRRLRSNAFFAGVIVLLLAEALFVDVEGPYVASFLIFEYALRMLCHWRLGCKTVSRQSTITNICDGVALLVDVIFLYCAWSVGPGAKSITGFLETFRDDLPVRANVPVSEFLARGLRFFLRSCGRILYPLGILLFRILWLCYARLRRLCGYVKDLDGGLENEERFLDRGEVGIDEETFRRYISAMAMRSTSAWPEKKFSDFFLRHVSSDGASIESKYLSKLLQDLRYSCAPAEVVTFSHLARGKLRNRICFDDFVLASKLLCDSTLETEAFASVESRRHKALRAARALVARWLLFLATFVGEFLEDLANLTTNLYILAAGVYSEDILENKLETYAAGFNMVAKSSPFSAILSPVTGLLAPLFSIISFSAEMVAPDVNFDQGVTCSGMTSLIGK